MTTTRATDPTMTAITAAVLLGRDGDSESARHDLLDIWKRIGVTGDPFHRCTLAHYLADLYDDPAEALIWDIRALDAADIVTDDRAKQYDVRLHVAGFYPSLYLNIADDLRRLGSFVAASEHVDSADKHTTSLNDDAYGEMIRAAISEARQGIDNHNTERRTGQLPASSIKADATNVVPSTD